MKTKTEKRRKRLQLRNILIRKILLQFIMLQHHLLERRRKSSQKEKLKQRSNWRKITILPITSCSLRWRRWDKEVREPV